MPPPVSRLVVLDAITFGDAPLERFEAWDATVHPFTAPHETADRIRGYPLIVVNKVVLGRSLLFSDAAAVLKLIAVAATGTDNIDLEAARERGIAVSNVPGYAGQTVAQFTLALILELATRAGAYAELVRRGEWSKSPVYTLLAFPTLELQGKTLGIVGHGNIGRRVAEMARGFGMEILIAARPGSSGAAPQGRVALEEVLARADFLSLHCPLTPETKGLIDRRALSLMKRGAYLVNTARGALVDEAALLEALREGRLAGAALDVISREPPPEDHPIVRAARELPNLIVTPHCAWSAREARERLLDEAAKNIQAFLNGAKRNRLV